MKRIISVLMTLLMLAPVLAIDASDFRIRMGSMMAVTEVTETYTNTFSMDTSTISWKTCHLLENYQLGECDYLYKCYVIMPEGCEELDCSKDYFCSEITDLQPIETITVQYTAETGDIGKTYAVAAMILKSHMTYDWGTKTWTDTTTLIESTKQSDFIEIKGAPTPPIPNPLVWLGQALTNLKTWLCGALPDWIC